MIFLVQVRDVKDHKLEDRMESFFLAETTKYLYLLFTPDHWLHNTGDTGTIVKTPHGECILDAGTVYLRASFLTTPKYFCIKTIETKVFFHSEILIDVWVSSMLWVYGHYNSFRVGTGEHFYTSESDVHGRQILTSKDGPCTERVKHHQGTIFNDNHCLIQGRSYKYRSELLAVQCESLSAHCKQLPCHTLRILGWLMICL